MLCYGVLCYVCEMLQRALVAAQAQPEELWRPSEGRWAFVTGVRDYCVDIMYFKYIMDTTDCTNAQPPRVAPVTPWTPWAHQQSPHAWLPSGTPALAPRLRTPRMAALAAAPLSAPRLAAAPRHLVGLQALRALPVRSWPALTT